MFRLRAIACMSASQTELSCEDYCCLFTNPKFVHTVHSLPFALWSTMLEQITVYVDCFDQEGHAQSDEVPHLRRMEHNHEPDSPP